MGDSKRLQLTGTLMENFPAERINDPDNFLSLLFYFGMVTIDGTYQGLSLIHI